MTRHFSEERGPEGRTNEIIFFFKIFNFLEKKQNEKSSKRKETWTLEKVDDSGRPDREFGRIDQ